MKHEISPNCPKCQAMLNAHQVDPLLRRWFEDTQVQRPELHLAFTYRGKIEQDRFFREGKSKAKFGKSPHNYLPAMAIDVFFLVQGKYNLDMGWLQNMAATAPDGIMWGGSFKSFPDGPHFEIADWKTSVLNYPDGNK